MKKIIIIILLILLIPFFIITIKDIDREEVNPTLNLILTETHNSIIDLNNHTLSEVFEDSTIYSLGKNWFDYTQVYSPMVFNGLVDGRNTLKLDYSSTSVYSDWYQSDLLENTQYTIKFDYKKDSTSIGSSYFIIYYTDSTNSNILLNSTSWTTVTITSTISKTISQFQVVQSTGKAITYFDIDTFQLELGTDATTYESYKSSLNNDLPPFVHWFNLDTLGISDLTVSQMDYWYNVYTTYSSSYDYIQFGTATAGDYLLLQQLIIDNASEDFKLYRDDVIDEIHYTMTQNVDNIVVSDVDDNELFILYSDDTYISRTSLSDTTILSFVGYNITGYIDGDFNNTVLVFFWIIPILLVGALFFIILKGKERE